MTDINWCYTMCDSLIIPLVTLVTAAWTLYQHYQLRRVNKALKIKVK